MSNVEDRCRLVLIAPDLEDDQVIEQAVSDALRGGDVASVILPQYGLDDSSFQKRSERLVPIIQRAGAAALIAGETRVATRTGADGVHVSGGIEDMKHALDRFSPQMIVGGGRAKERHAALEIGELRPDYIFFGRLDGDIKQEPHAKNIALGQWWADLIEIPCVIMGGQNLESIADIADTGAEFAALRHAVFADPAQAAMRVSEANALLDEKAPRFAD
ncbi:MAG: thiamine phosphate synthase [Alphaproteobacteria bacterium]|nr:thiamine phosphate synthase [Alphaproteobacteria bacterium]